MKIPYGVSDFGLIRSKGFFYADKTPFLPVLEAGYRHVVFLRPRRFGKSTLISLLEHYRKRPGSRSDATRSWTRRR